MKNRIALLPALLLFGLTSLVYTGCKDDEDSTPPVVTLNGDQSLNLFLNTPFIDLGATATDDQDGTLGVTVSGTVDEDKVGVYTLTYSATDAAGNTGSAFRVITIENETQSDPFEGTYSCTITQVGSPPYTYTENLSVSTTLNDALEWSKFGNYSNANGKLNIVFGTNNQVQVPTQTIVCGSPAVARTFSGSGTKSGSGAQGSQIILQIDETVNAQTAAFVYTYTKQ